MINEEWNKTQNDAPFVAFYDMCAVTFVLLDEMADVLIAGLQWFILIPQFNHTGYHRPIGSHSILYLTFDLPIQNLQMAHVLKVENNCANLYLKSIQNCRRYGLDKNLTFKRDLDIWPT